MLKNKKKTFCFGSTSSRIWNGRRGQTEISKTFFPRDLLQQEYIYLQDWLVDFYLFLIKIASELKGIYHTNTQVVLSSEWIENKEGKSLNWHETKNHVTFWKKAIIVHAQKVLFGRLWHNTYVRTLLFSPPSSKIQMHGNCTVFHRGTSPNPYWNEWSVTRTYVRISGQSMIFV